ncbi:PRC-barrel domain-containing protein [Microbacterium sp. NPDC089318]
MIDSYRINSLFDAEVVDADGSRIGTVKHVYVDPDGGQPLFVGVTTGWFGRSESFVPLRDADFDGEVLHVEYDKDTVKHAPRIDADGSLTDDDIDRIQDYYDDGGADDSGDDDSGDDEDGRRRAAERDTTRDDAPTGQSAPVDDQRPPRRRIRVHRYVIADERTGTSPLSHDDGTLSHDDGTFSHDDGTLSHDDGTFSHDDGTPDRGRSVDQTQYETVEESRVDRIGESREGAADESRDLGGDELRRRRE